MAEREARLAEELAAAQGNLELLRRLHTASQNQLFSMQSASEEAAAGVQVGVRRASVLTCAAALLSCAHA